MEPSYEYKYTDRDVRENPNLILDVKAYLGWYGGDFDFLIKARQYLAVQGTLPTGIIRGVLNCMRTDPSWIWRVPILSTPATPPSLYQVDISRPRRIELKATFNKPYVMSPWKTAYLVHILYQRESRMWWHPHTGIYECLLQGWCNISYSQRRNLIMVDTIPEGRRECTRCRAALENNQPTI